MNNQEWRTSPVLWKLLDDEFCFQLDAAANPENKLCENFITPHQNGLAIDWINLAKPEETNLVLRAYCNPGFHALKPWMEKAHREAQKSPSAITVVVGLVSPSTAWWRFCVKNATEIRLFAPRIQFVPAKGVVDSSNSRENCLVVFHKKLWYQPPARIWTWRWQEEKPEGNQK